MSNNAKVMSEFVFRELLINTSPDKTIIRAPFDAKIGHGLGVTRWNGLNFFII